MKKKHKEVPTISLEVWSVEVAGLSAGGPYVEGIKFLREKGFLSVAQVEQVIEEKKRVYPHRINGVAPSNGSEKFVFISYIPNERELYMHMTMFLIDRGSKVEIDSGTILFKPDNVGDYKTFTIKGENMNDWRVMAKVPSVEVAAKIALFAGRKSLKLSENHTIIEESLMEDQAEAERNQAAFLTSSIIRAKERSTEFAEFLREYCKGSTEVMVVSNAIVSYLEQQGEKKNIKKFCTALGLPLTLCYNLIALKDLHPDLWPALEVPRKSGALAAQGEITIEAGARLSEVEFSKQVLVWNEVKDVQPHEEKILKIKKHARKPLVVM